MTFKQTLDRLRNATSCQVGAPQDMCVVLKKDLMELLSHFDRIDEELRQLHHEKTVKENQ